MMGATQSYELGFMTAPRLIIRDLTISRGGYPLITGLNAQLEQGQVMLLRGPNGCGKTTLLRGLAGLIPQDHGDFAINGISAASDHANMMRQLVLIGHRNANAESLDAYHALAMTAGLAGLAPSADHIMMALETFAMAGLAKRQISHLSAGQQRRLALARLALFTAEPHRLWLMDEPFNALDDDAASTLNHLLNHHLESGGAAVISGHGAMPITANQTLHLDQLKDQTQSGKKEDRS